MAHEITVGFTPGRDRFEYLGDGAIRAHFRIGATEASTVLQVKREEFQSDERYQAALDALESDWRDKTGLFLTGE